MEDVQKLQVLVPKTISIMKNILDLYDKKSRGETVHMDELLRVLKGVEKDDIIWALQMLQKINSFTSQQRKSRKNLTADELINQGFGLATDNTRNNHTEMAQHLLQALFLTTASGEYPPADVLLKTMKITDPEVIKDFKRQYDTVVKKTQKEAVVHPIEANMIRWAWFGKFFFYGGTALFFLIILRKIVRAFLRFTQPIMNVLAAFFTENTKAPSRILKAGKRGLQKVIQIF